MSEQPSPMPAAEAVKTKVRRTPAAIRVGVSSELTLATEVAAAAEKPVYATTLAEEGVDAAFVTGLRAKIATANSLIANAGGKVSAKRTTSREEAKLKEALVEAIAAVQARAKRKYPRGDPRRATYYIGQVIDASRAQLEAASQSVLVTLAQDTLPGQTPEAVAALTAAREAYLVVQSAQSGEQAEASSARAQLDATVKEVAELRRQVQYAVDAAWPASRKANAATRVEFKLPPNRALQ